MPAKGRKVPAKGRKVLAKVPALEPAQSALDEESQETDESDSEEPDHHHFEILSPSDMGHGSSSTSGPSSKGSTTHDSRRSITRRALAIIELNSQCSPLPMEKFCYDESIAQALRGFEPYQPLIESKYFPTVKVWVLQKQGDDLVVRLEDCTKHVRLIHQVR